MRIGALFEIRHAGTRCNESSTHIDLLNQIEARDIDRLRCAQVNSGGVVDANIDAAKNLGRALHRRLYSGSIADIDLQWQRLTPRSLDFLRGGINRARQFGMRFGGFCRYSDVGAVASRTQCDGQANAAATAGDEQSFVCKTHVTRRQSCGQYTDDDNQGTRRTRTTPDVRGRPGKSVEVG